MPSPSPSQNCRCVLSSYSIAGKKTQVRKKPFPLPDGPVSVLRIPRRCMSDGGRVEQFLRDEQRVELRWPDKIWCSLPWNCAVPELQSRAAVPEETSILWKTIVYACIRSAYLDADLGVCRPARILRSGSKVVYHSRISPAQCTCKPAAY